MEIITEFTQNYTDFLNLIVGEYDGETLKQNKTKLLLMIVMRKIFHMMMIMK